jgi:multiple sugar transport system substrate-binding protein
MKKALAIVLALAVLLGLSACAGGAGGASPTPSPTASPAASPSPASPSPSAAPAPVSLKFWYWADNTTQSDLMKSIVKNFNETNGMNITVTAEEYPWDSGGFTDSTFNAIKGGGGPDLSTIKLSAGKVFAANKLLADLTPVP